VGGVAKSCNAKGGEDRKAQIHKWSLNGRDRGGEKKRNLILSNCSNRREREKDPKVSECARPNSKKKADPNSC